MSEGLPGGGITDIGQGSGGMEFWERTMLYINYCTLILA